MDNQPRPINILMKLKKAEMTEEEQRIKLEYKRKYYLKKDYQNEQDIKKGRPRKEMKKEIGISVFECEGIGSLMKKRISELTEEEKQIKRNYMDKYKKTINQTPEEYEENLKKIKQQKKKEYQTQKEETDLRNRIKTKLKVIELVTDEADDNNRNILINELIQDLQKLL